jgi:hypothetical protein
VKRAPLLVSLVGLGLAGSAWAQDPERIAMGHVALTTDVSLVRGCALVGRVKDDEVKDLRRKIVRLGGDTAVVAFGFDDIHADVYRCPTPRAGASPTPIPPPPAGTPPPPPPGLSTPPATTPPPPPTR